jgi:hypothetical protein
MVLYHADGRVVKAHEDYLEREAARHATAPKIQYEDQIEVCKKHTPEAREQERRARIIIDRQVWYSILFTSKIMGLSGKRPVSGIPSVEIPEDLLEKIHLYNCMLQLGLPSFIQRPLINALVSEIYRTPLQECQLEVLEMTVARFLSLGVAVLDPVLSHLVGTYAFRSIEDRQHGGPEENAAPNTDRDAVPDTASPAQDLTPQSVADDFKATHNAFDFSQSKRQLLTYSDHPGKRLKYPNDTFILPPRLPVLAHSIRHWSNVRANGSAAAATTGYPLNVGRVNKYYRRRAASPIRTQVRNRDWVEYGTYRLKGDEEYQKHAPGRGTGEENGDEVPQQGLDIFTTLFLFIDNAN